MDREDRDDRESRQEQRRRGGAKREFATGDIIIKTPKRKWTPISEDAGALITQDLVVPQSPEVIPENYGSQDHEYPNHDSTPQTPYNQQHDEVPEPESNRSYVSIRNNENVQHTPREPKEKVQKPKKSNNKRTNGRLSSSSTDRIYPKPRHRSKPVDYEPINIQDKEVPESMTTWRHPTAITRVSAIDIMDHYLANLIPKNGIHFQKFYQLNHKYLRGLLDLTLSNNKTITRLKNEKVTKEYIRNKLFEVKKEINENMKKVEELREKNKKLQERTALKKKLNLELKKIDDDETKDKIKFDPSKLIEDLNHLNGVLDPEWGLIDKLKAVNKKLYAIDKQL